MRRLNFPTPNNFPSASKIFLTSLIISSLLVTYKPSLIPWSNPRYFSTFLSFFSFLTIFKLFYLIILYPHFLSPLRHLPGPSGASWWNGQYHRIAAQSVGVPPVDWHDNILNNGLIRFTTLLNMERLTPTTPEVLREVLQTKSFIFRKPWIVQNQLGNVLGKKGLLFAEGEVHRFQRRHIGPAFAIKQLQGMMPTFLGKSRELIGCIERVIESKGRCDDNLTVLPITGATETLKSEENENRNRNGWTVIDMMPWLSRVTLDIIGSAGFGHDFESLRDDDNELATAYRNIFSLSSRRGMILNLAYHHFSLSLLQILSIPRRRKLQAPISTIRNLCLRMVHEKKRELANVGKVGEKDLLSLITKDSPFSEEEMQHQLMTFLAAGHETTATALNWALYLLVHHPDIQSKLRHEIRNTYPTLSSLTSTTYENLDTLPYLRSVTLEVLRLYCPIPGMLREAAEDTTLADVFVPKGTMVIIAPWAINRSKRFWGPTADEFRPSRWENGNHENGNNHGDNVTPDDENKNFATQYQFMTFSQGPRNCIGKNFARLEFKCILAALVGRFEFRRPNPEESEMKVTIRGGVTIKPEGMRVGVRAVDAW